VGRDDIDVSVENGTLTLRGEKKYEKEVDSESAHRQERFYGSFTRSFVLPTAIDPDHIQAGYKDGILEVVLPKAEEAKPRRIRSARRPESCRLIIGAPARGPVPRSVASGRARCPMTHQPVRRSSATAPLN